MIFLDESKFSANTVLKKGFATKYLNCHPPYIINHPTVVNLIAGISVKNGLEGFILTRREVNSTEFLKILQQFDKNGSNYVLFGDNASYHRSI